MNFSSKCILLVLPDLPIEKHLTGIEDFLNLLLNNEMNCDTNT
jgi:hypothetical protein